MSRPPFVVGDCRSNLCARSLADAGWIGAAVGAALESSATGKRVALTSTFKWPVAS